jgi:hypothetical protein
MRYYVVVENEKYGEIYRHSKIFETLFDAFEFAIKSLDFLENEEHPVIYKEERIELDSFTLQIGRAFLKRSK